MRRLLAIALLLPALAGATPVRNPATDFSGWPWSKNTGTWLNVDATNHMVQQLMLALDDRAKACLVPEAGKYEKTYLLSAGIKTNYSYAVTNPATGLTTNFHPTLQLSFEQRTWNVYGTNVYYYPKDPGNNAAGYTNATMQSYVTSNMMVWLNEAIETICTNFAQVGTNQYAFFRTSTNSIYPHHPPRFNMPALLTAAGYGSKCVPTRDDANVITGGTWEWETPLPSNNVITTAALDERAACLSQLKYVLFEGKACSPFFVGYYDEDVYPSTVYLQYKYETNYSETTLNSFSWSQRDVSGWTPTVTWTSNSWTNACPDYPSTVYDSIDIVGERVLVQATMQTDNPPDWPQSGWYWRLQQPVTLSIRRGDTNRNPWVISSDSFDHWSLYNMPLFWSISSGTTNEGISGTLDTSGITPHQSKIQVASMWTNAVWTNQAKENPGYGVDYWLPIATTNITWTPETHSWDEMVLGTLTTNNFYIWGKYQTHSGVKTNWYTNLNLTIPAITWASNNAHSVNYSNITAINYGESNGTVHAGGDSWWEPGWFTNGDGQAAGITNDGSITAGSPTASQPAKRRHIEVYAYKPDKVILFSNITCRSTVWAIGDKISAHSEWGQDAKYRGNKEVVEWSDVAYVTTNGYVFSNDQNIFTNAFYTNRYEHLASFDETAINANGGMLYYRDMVDNAAAVAPNYLWDGYEAYTRMFWGIGNLIFLLEYDFPKRN